MLLNQAGSTRIDGHDPLQAAGGSLRDMTRIGGANPRIWVDIFLDNREALAAALGEQRRAIERVEQALASEDAGFLARWIGEASGHRRRLLATAFADPGELHRLRIHISDRPGVLAGIFQALGAERINVEDFEFDHVSADRGGTLTMLVVGRGRGAAGGRGARAAGLRRRRRAGDRRMSARGRPHSIDICSYTQRRVTVAEALFVEPVPRLVGHLAVPGDKSISHRAVLIGAICDGETRISGFGRSADTEATIAAVRALGVEVYEHGAETLRVFGKGLAGSGSGPSPIDCANAGTLVRLLAGILAGQVGEEFELTGRRVALAAADGTDRGTARADGRRHRDDRRAACRWGSRGGRCRRSTTRSRWRARR